MMGLTACALPRGGPPTAPAASGQARKPSSKAVPPAIPGLVAGSAGVTRAVAQTGDVVQLTGKVKLLSDQSGGLLSDQGAGVISNHSGNLISNHGGSLISNHGGSLLGKAKWRLTQNAALRQFWLADAEITVLDAAGRQLVNDQGAPLAATTDQTGAYRLRGVLPDENLLLRIKLWQGGQLMAIAPRRTNAEQTIEIDTATTLGASYVLERFVKGDQKTFDKLPAAEADQLRQELSQAARTLQQMPSYDPAEAVRLTESLRSQTPALDRTLKTIESLLLGGLGDGRQATRVALSRPRGLVVLPDGSLMVGEETFGRVRRIAADGTLTTYMDVQGGTIQSSFPGLVGFAARPEGGFYVASQVRRRIYLVEAGQAPQVVAGSGEIEGDTFREVPGPQTGLTPVDLAYDGTARVLWLAQRRSLEGDRWVPNRLFRLTADGQFNQVPLPPENAPEHIASLALGPQGDLYVLRSGQLFRRDAASGSWTREASGLKASYGKLAVRADGAIAVPEDDAGRVSVKPPGGSFAPIPPPEDPALVLKAPDTVRWGADGTLYVVDRDRGLVLARNAAGVWRHVAGSNETSQSGADRLTFNSPAGVVFDPTGRLLVSEGAGHAIKRVEGTSLEVIAGGVTGKGGGEGLRKDLQLQTPGAMRYRGEDLIIADLGNHRILSITPTDQVRTLVGLPQATMPSDLPLTVGGAAVPGRDFSPPRPMGLAVGPDGAVYFSSIRLNQIYKWTPDGQVRAIAGRGNTNKEAPADSADGPAGEVALGAPMGLAFKPGEPDNLYFADFANCRVRRVVGLSTATPQVETVAGLGRLQSILKLTTNPTGWEALENGLKATEVLVAVPTEVLFDASGTMYLAEGGTRNLKLFLEDVEALKGVQLPNSEARLRTITADGRIQTLMGPGGKLYPDPKDPESLGLPTNMAFDAQGRLAIVDIRSNTVRILPREAL